MMDFWSMPCPFDAERDYYGDLIGALSNMNEPMRTILVEFAQNNKQAILAMLRAKAESDHRKVLTAIAEVLRERGIDIPPAP